MSKLDKGQCVGLAWCLKMSMLVAVQWTIKNVPFNFPENSEEYIYIIYMHVISACKTALLVWYSLYSNYMSLWSS